MNEPDDSERPEHKGRWITSERFDDMIWICDDDCPKERHAKKEIPL